MRLCVLGASGRTGMLVVDAALARGHTVTCLVRSPDDTELPLAHERMAVLAGDATDEAAVDAVLDRVDAVVDLIGPRRGSPAALRSTVVGNVLRATTRHDVRRIVHLTGAGVRVDGDRPGMIDRMFVAALRWLQPELLGDSQRAVAAIMASDLDWTIARVPRLTDARTTRHARAVAQVGSGSGTSVGRAAVARFLVDELEQATWVRRAPVLSEYR